MRPAIEALEAESFRRSRIRPPPIRLKRDQDVVDLIARPAATTRIVRADLDAVLPCLELDGACTPVRIGDEVVRVASPDTLVILKAVAWVDRYAESDLVDVARIALLDRDEGVVGEALAARAAALPPPVLTCLRRLNGAFERDGAWGPAVLANAALAELPGLLPEDELELEIRSLACAAVRGMLRNALA